MAIVSDSRKLSAPFFSERSNEILRLTRTRMAIRQYPFSLLSWLKERNPHRTIGPGLKPEWRAIDRYRLRRRGRGLANIRVPGCRPVDILPLPRPMPVTARREGCSRQGGQYVPYKFLIKELGFGCRRL